MAKERLLK